MRRWAVELTGRNSVSPSTTPRTTASGVAHPTMSSPPSTLITLPVIQCVPGRDSTDDRPRHVLGRGQPAAAGCAASRLDDRLVARDLAQGGRVGHPGADGVGGDAVRRELDGELADVRLERGLGRRHRAVAWHTRSPPDEVMAKMRAAAAQEPARRAVLRPVDEPVRHHVERHVHLRLVRPPSRIGDEELERAEGERVQQHADLARLAALVEHVRHRGRDLGALLGVGGVDVEEQACAPERLDLGGDALDVGQRGPRSRCTPKMSQPARAPARARSPRRSRTTRRG